MRQGYVHTHSKWFAIEADHVLERLESDGQAGLLMEEATARLQEFGPNALPTHKKESLIIKFLRHFHDILIYILFAAAIVTLVLGHYADTIVIALVAVVNACIGFFQEHKAEKALDDIKALLSLKANVIRSGTRQEIDATDVTLGDLVLLEPGDKIPADLRLLRANNLKIEESALTGEAVPSEKQTKALDADVQLGDRSNMAFSGTTVSAGTGAGMVVAIGLETEIGHISQMITQVDVISTPLIRQLEQFGKTVATVIIGVSVAVFLFGHFFRSYEATELLLATIGLAIAAIPEGLPAILSIILAIGVQNMARRKAIVRTLPSVETLGSVSVICSDKTGTLTKNEMTVKSLVLCEASYAVSGTGYAPTGHIERNGNVIDVAETPLLVELTNCFHLCNDSVLQELPDGTWNIKGDPTEGALQTLFRKTKQSDLDKSRIATLPFDSEYKYMATLVDDADRRVLFIKGAPDRLLSMANQEQGTAGGRPLDHAYWESAMSELAAKGQRLLGAAIKVVDKDMDSIDHADLEEGLVFLGLAGIMDPPRDEVVAAITSCKKAGIRVKMITGDHVETAKAIGLELGIGDGVNALTGRELDEMTDEQLEVAVRKHDIFARTSPEHKLKLVKALQNAGLICAMTGDGVNDAPALKMANVGVAMGIKGTEVTKDSAEIVLADDNFNTIVAAVEEGRRVYDNLKKTILFILPTNGAESFLIIASILFGTMLPLTPVQILWVNMVTSVTISLALAFEKAEPEAMERPPRGADEKILNGYFIWRILFVSVLIGGLTLIMNLIMVNRGWSTDLVRTITVQSIVLSQMFHLFNSRTIRQSAFAVNPFSNKMVLVVCGLLVFLQLSVTYLPFMNSIFDTVPLAPQYWLFPILLGLVVFLVVEGEKALMRQLDIQRKG